MNYEEMNIDDIVNSIKFNCDPRFSFPKITDLILGNKKSNFIGGCGDIRTKHEQIFSLLYPGLKEQVSFGSGKGGYEKYTFKRVIVDFYDEENKLAIEIDGENHKSHYRSLKDRIKELMLLNEYGIRICRITNKQVENLLIERVTKNLKDTAYDDWYQQNKSWRQD